MPPVYPNYSHDADRSTFEDEPALPRTTALVVSLSTVFVIGLALIALGLR